MALKAGNEVVGGNTLRRAAIESPNFVTGVSGWIIRQDGSAEFNNVVIRNGQVVSGTALFYAGTPAAGNLVASISAAGGTDSFGNAYLAGVSSYSTAAVFTASQLQGGLANFYTATSQAGPWTLRGQVAGDNANNLNLDSQGLGAVRVPLHAFQALAGASVTGGLTVAGGETTDTLAVTASQNLQLITVTNNLAGASTALILVFTAAAGDTWMGFRVTGDSNSRLIFDTTGAGASRVRFGSGSAGPDISLSRLAANVLGVVTADLAVETLGRGLQVKEGANAKQGTAQLNGGSPASVVVANTAITANSRVQITNNALAGVAVPPSYAISARTPGASFTILSSANLDTSTVAYEIFEPAP